jgi:hypothetical protein
MLARVPDSGSPKRDRQGPRPGVRLSIREQVRAAAAAGTPKVEIAATHRVTVRTVYRYLAEPEDLVRSVAFLVLDEARDEFGLVLNRDQVDDIATEIARRLRAQGLR